MYQLEEFNYSKLDERTADFLMNKESNMRQIMTKAYTDIGKELKDAQERLSNHRNGIFEEWYTSIGLTKSQVNRIINRYNFIVSNWDNKETIEKLPVSLSYEISKPSATKEQQRKVLDGEIKTLKEFKAHIDGDKKVELDKITAEIKIYQNHLKSYKQWFIELIEKVKRHPKHYAGFIEDLNLEGHEFAEELREPTDAEFFDYVVNNIERGSHRDIEKLNL